MVTGTTAMTLAFAGCAGDGDDGSSDDGAGDDGSEDDNTGDDGETEDGTDSDNDGESDDSTNGDGGDTDDGSDETDTDDGTDNGDGSNSDDGSDSSDGDDGADGSNGDSDAPTLGESYQWAESFIAEISIEQSETPVNSVIIYFNGGNFRQEIDTQEGTLEMYNVDGTLYQVQDGQCFTLPEGEAPEMETGVDPQSEDEVLGDQSDLSPTGTDSIDGEEVYVYEYEIQGDPATMYVSTATGYVRRFEYPQGTIDYRSWGDVDPIELPEACEQ